MRYKIFGVMVLVAALLLVAATSALAAYPSPDEPVLLTEPAVAKLPPVAIGAHRLAGTHLVPPAKGVVLAELREQGLPLDASPEELEAALEDYYARFHKQSETWVNPKFQEWVLEREAQLAADTVAPMAIQPVTATVFAMAIDFGATETFTIPVEQPDGSCMTETTTIEGPLAGEIPYPPATDNFTLWYSPTLYVDDASWYENIIFGYEGTGRTRMDLTDPDDGLPGINLEGLTVQDYFDNVAGEGNVYITGTVEGWVTVPHSEGYYGADICRTGGHQGGAGHTAADLVADALAVFMADHPTYYDDTSLDAFWPQFDGNEDGVLDTFWVIHAGMGQEADGGEQGTFALWSHSSDVRNYSGYPDGIKVYEGDPGTTDDDIIVGPYTVQPENSEVGVFSEEFGHNFFGFPDLYTTDASNSIGDWNIMSGGAWMGWLGGTRPASMPLWFKMIAAFDTAGELIPVNWQEPMVTRDYQDPMAEVTIGQLEKTPDGVNKGVRVDLPDYTLATDNMADPENSKGAYSGTGRDETDAIMSQEVEVGAAATGILTIDAYWDIEDNWDYGYVMVNGMPIPDMDGVTTNYDPNGNNLGNGLTSYGSGELRFDLSAYAGQIIELALRYKTDAAVTYSGWWVDNVALDGTLIDDFEGATTPGSFPGWTNSDPGWLVVPTIATHQRYYLVEWRAMTKYDQMIHKSAYIHNQVGPTTGDVVSRIPYNMPAALLYYRDTQYGSTYAMGPNQTNPPSVGSKYQLLIVDQNWDPTRIFSGTVGTADAYEGYWTGRVSSYDSGLTLQDTDAFTIPTYYGIPGLPPQVYPSKPAVTQFNDTLGYYAGYYYGPPCDPGYVCNNEQYGSAVIPARDLYSTRIVDFAGNPIYGFYGYPWSPSWLGSGMPGDDNAQFGVNIELKDMVHVDPYASTATLGFYNYSVDIESSVDKTSLSGYKGQTYELTYQIVVENTGTETAEDISVTPVPVAGDLMPTDVDATKGEFNYATQSWEISSLMAGEVATATVLVEGTVSEPETVSVMIVANDGQVDRGPWFFDTDIETYAVYLPMVGKNYTPPEPMELTILHTNDTHAHLEPFEPFGEPVQGGVARRYTAIQEVKAEGGNVVLVDAGDAFQGTLFFNVWQGEEEAYFMNALGYEAMAVGNHEFDSGPAALADFIDLADFPVLSANIDASADADLAGLIEAYTILEVGGEQVGVLGLTTEETEILSSPGPDVVFNDTVTAAQATVDELEGMGINKIIALTHLGYGPDQAVAAAVDGIDVIVGGHSHTKLGSMEGAAGPYPTVVDSLSGEPVLVVTAQDWGRYLGRLDVAFSGHGRIVSYSGEPIFMDESIAEDPTIAADVATFAEPIEDLKNTVIGESEVLLEGTRELVRSQETNLGNLICDAMLWATEGEGTQICVQNGGGIRASIPPGEVTMGQVLEVLPFGNQIATFGLTGADVWAALENGVSQWESGAGRFPQVGGLKYVFDPSLDPGSRIVSVHVKQADGTYEPIDLEEVYKLTSNNFMRTGGDGYTMFAENAIDPYDAGDVLADAVADYITAHSPVSPAVEGRITKLDKLVTILHTNDIHGRFPTEYYYSTPEGMTFLASHIAAERAKNPNTLLLDAGDTFQGNAFAQYFRNETPNPIAGAMNMLDYDAMVIGNHEYNFGAATFSTMLGQLDFPILGSANVDDDGTYGFINDSVDDYINLDVDGVKVSVFGLTNPEVPIYELPSNIEGLTFYTATTTAETLVPEILADEDPDLLVALTHIGYDVYKGSTDKDMFIAQEVPGIDVIVGGHSHTKLDPAVMITSTVNPAGTLVAQTGAYGQYLGKINVGFTGNITDGYEIVFREGYLLEAKDTTEDPAMVDYLAPFEVDLDEYTEHVIGETTAPLDALDAYTEETTGANLQADAAVHVLSSEGLAVDLHLSGAMSNKKVADDATPENPVELTVGDMYTLMPYENSLLVMEMNGPQLKQVLERAYRNWYYYNYVEDYGGYSHYTTCMLDVDAGGVITYSDTYPALPDGNNVVSLVIDGTPVDFADADTYYNVSTVNYLAAGSCNFNDDNQTLWPLDQIVADTQFYVRDAVINYILAMGTVSPEVEGRLQWVTP